MPLRPKAIVCRYIELPQELTIERVLPDQQRLQVRIHHLFGDAWGERRIADADVAGVGQDLDNEPTMEPEPGHGVGGQIQQVHGIRAEVRLGRHGFPPPLHDARANIGNFHMRISPLAVTGWTTRMASRMIQKAAT